MAKKSREQLAEEFFAWDWGEETEEFQAFYHLPHDEKANINTFTGFCEKHNGGLALVLSDDEICDNKDLVLIAAKYGVYGNYHILSKRLLSDPDIALALVHGNRGEYHNIDFNLRDDPELMLKAVKKWPNVYRYLSARVKADREIVNEIVRRDPWQLKYLVDVREEYSAPILMDKELAIVAAKSYPRCLYESFYEELLRDDDVLEAAFCLSNPKVYKERLMQNTWALPFVDPVYWKDDIDLIRHALKEDGSLYVHLPDDKKKDRKLALLAVKNCPKVLGELPEEFRDDDQIVKAALQEDSEGILAFASDRLRADYKTVFRAVKYDPLSLEFASEELRDNREIVLRAINGYGGALEYASSRLQEDEELKRIAEQNM